MKLFYLYKIRVKLDLQKKCKYNFISIWLKYDCIPSSHHTISKYGIQIIGFIPLFNTK